MSTLRTHHSWRFRTAWRPHRRPTNRQEAVDALAWLRAHAPAAELTRAWSRIAGRQLVPMAERRRVARELQAQLDGASPHSQAPNAPTNEENWRHAGRILTGAHAPDVVADQPIDWRARHDGAEPRGQGVHSRGLVRRWSTPFGLGAPVMPNVPDFVAACAAVDGVTLRQISTGAAFFLALLVAQ